jgi:hypothetical protein
MNENAFAPPTSTPAPALQIKQQLPSMPRGRGRPRKEIEQQATGVRMPRAMHFKVRALAMQEQISMGDLIIRALKEYADKRAVSID